MDKVRRKIGPEFIDVGDWKNMVKLFVRVAETGHDFDGSTRALRERVEKRYRRLSHFLRQSRSA
jgi:hypothetical protein